MSDVVKGALLVGIPGYLVVSLIRKGHSRFVADLMVGSILAVLCSALAVLESINLLLWIPRYALRRLVGERKQDPREASAAATGKRTTDQRKIVIFDGVCVLCNRFGRFVVAHLPDPNEVSFVPFQDPHANPHIKVERLQEEFGFKAEQLQNRIAVVDGDRLLWGPDAVIAVFGWCYWPYPLAAVGLLVPWPVRDALYLTVAKNRYEWFGTQPLDMNFAKNLCPYIYFKDLGRKKAE